MYEIYKYEGYYFLKMYFNLVERLFIAEVIVLGKLLITMELPPSSSISMCNCLFMLLHTFLCEVTQGQCICDS